VTLCVWGVGVRGSTSDGPRFPRKVMCDFPHVGRIHVTAGAPKLSGCQVSKPPSRKCLSDEKCRNAAWGPGSRVGGRWWGGVGAKGGRSLDSDSCRTPYITAPAPPRRRRAPRLAPDGATIVHPMQGQGVESLFLQVLANSRCQCITIHLLHKVTQRGMRTRSSPSPSPSPSLCPQIHTVVWSNLAPCIFISPFAGPLWVTAPLGAACGQPTIKER
jgi:hypothetical protein